MEILKNDTAELCVEVGKISSERLPAITENLTIVAEQIKIVENGYKKMESQIAGFVQSELKKNDWDIPLDYDYLDGKENLMTDLEYPLDMFDLDGMPREEILPELQKIKDSIEEFKRESDRRYEELKSENEELKRENKRLNSRITTIETLKNK
ncbi:hypothetical protein SLEP1_g18583 [Rubroshorea leprosula]|uniref:Uncharacterized protein n=1 Tax=Rubroshorea leprosula TaxID=152421 RepID=A0AAV5J8K4_9ROSI|nr:hypothetical protein SLEP1_g18583 [Rubroshorea leprosula]